MPELFMTQPLVRQQPDTDIKRHHRPNARTTYVDRSETCLTLRILPQLLARRGILRRKWQSPLATCLRIKSRCEGGFGGGKIVKPFHASNTGLFSRCRQTAGNLIFYFGSSRKSAE